MHVGQAHVEQEGSSAGTETREPEVTLQKGPVASEKSPEPLPPCVLRKYTSVYSLQRQWGDKAS